MIFDTNQTKLVSKQRVGHYMCVIISKEWFASLLSPLNIRQLEQSRAEHMHDIRQELIGKVI